MSRASPNATAVLNKLMEILRADSDQPEKLTAPNQWVLPDGSVAYYELGKDNLDGRITGSIWKIANPQYKHKIGRFTIAAEGTVMRFPGSLMRQRRQAEKAAN